MSIWCVIVFFFSSRRRHTRFKCDWSSDVCSSDLGWKLSFPWDGTRTWLWLASSASVFNVFLIALLCYKLMHIRIIIPFVCTKMLIRSRPFDQHMDHQVLQRPFIMLICTRNPYG